MLILHLSHEGDNFMADCYCGFHKIASVVQKLIWGSDMTVVHSCTQIQH